MPYPSRDTIHKEDTNSHHLELIQTEENDPVFNNLEEGVVDEIIQQTNGL